MVGKVGNVGRIQKGVQERYEVGASGDEECANLRYPSAVAVGLSYRNRIVLRRVPPVYPHFNS